MQVMSSLYVIHSQCSENVQFTIVMLRLSFFKLQNDFEVCTLRPDTFHTELELHPSFSFFSFFCSGRDPYNTLISDQLRVPAAVVPGKYVLSIRWDCEKSAQVWTNCADIEIVAP